MLINDYPAVGAEYMKRAFPKDAFDCFGSEGAMFMREPERQPDWLCLLGVLQSWKRAQAKYGYQDKPLWTTEALYHSTNPGNLSLHGQGVRYVRDALLALANGVQRLAAQGGVNDSADDYRWSNWGSIGYCFRDPEFNPKPSFALFAWLTQILDQAQYAGKLPAGSTSLHVLDFKRQDGSHVYPVWVVRGRQEVTLEVAGGAAVVYDPFGNRLPAKPADKRLTLTVTDTPIYVTGTKVTGVADRQAVELPQEAGRVLLELEDTQRVKAVEKPSAVLEASWDYPRRKGAFKIEPATEDGTAALRVELLPDPEERKLLQRYVELAVAPPLVLPGRPYALTARVKGNGGWGRIMFELVDARGRVWTSCGNQYSGSTNSSDNRGDSYISFDGWQTLTIPLPGQYASPDQVVAWPHNFNWWPTNTPEWAEEQANYPKLRAEHERKLADYERLQKEYERPREAHAAAKRDKRAPGPPPQPPEKPGSLPPLVNRGISPVDYPLRLTKVIVAMTPHILYVDEEVAVEKPVIYVDRLGVVDPPEGF